MSWRYVDCGAQDPFENASQMPVLGGYVANSGRPTVTTSEWGATHLNVGWFDDIDEWRAAKPQLLDSVRVTPAAFVDAVRRCKLYDYKMHRWLDFKGRVTAEIRPLGR